MNEWMWQWQPADTGGGEYSKVSENCHKHGRFAKATAAAAAAESTLINFLRRRLVAFTVSPDLASHQMLNSHLHIHSPTRIIRTSWNLEF